MIPTSVKQSEEEADRILKEMTAENKNTGLNTSGEEKAPEAQPPALEPGKNQPAQDPAIVSQSEEWKQKYLVIQGKYNAEVPILADERNALKAENSRLMRDIESLKRLQSQNAAAAAVQDHSQTIKKLEEEYGDSIGAAFRDVVADYDSRIRAVQDKLNEAQSLQSAEQKAEPQPSAPSQIELPPKQKFWNAFVAAVPDWSVVNDNVEFRAWLGERDPITGYSYQDLLDIAQERLNAEGLVNIFNAFKQRKSQASLRQKELENQLSPGKSGGEDNPQQPKNTIPFKEVSQFYEDVRLGKYRGREAEQTRLTALYDLATVEGRVI